MRKLTTEDAFAIARAEAAVYPNLVPNMSPFQRKQIEDDLERLSFVKSYLLRQIYEPGLPMGTFELEDKNPDGNDNPTPDPGA